MDVSDRRRQNQGFATTICKPCAKNPRKWSIWYRAITLVLSLAMFGCVTFGGWRHGGEWDWSSDCLYNRNSLTCTTGSAISLLSIILSTYFLWVDAGCANMRVRPRYLYADFGISALMTVTFFVESIVLLIQYSDSLYIPGHVTLAFVRVTNICSLILIWTWAWCMGMARLRIYQAALPVFGNRPVVDRPT